MEDSVGTAPPKYRVRVKRKKTLFERIKKALSMPHLKRHERNQRLAIGTVVVLLAVYLVVVRPIVNYFFPYVPPKKAQTIPIQPKQGGNKKIR